MDNRGIPIVLPAKRLNTTPKRTQHRTTPKRYEAPPSPFFVQSIKNELSLLEAYDTFSESRFMSRYQPTSDDMRCNVLNLHKSNMFTEINSPRVEKNMRSTILTIETDIDEEHSGLPYLETSKKSRTVTASSPIEAKTPLGEEVLDTFADSQPDLLPSSTTDALIPTQHIQQDEENEQDIMVQPSSQQFVAPKAPLECQQQKRDECAPETPLLHIDEMCSDNQSIEKDVKECLSINDASLTKQPSPPPPPLPLPPLDDDGPTKRITRSQAKLMQENAYNNIEFAVPVAPPPRKRGRRNAAKLPEPPIVETENIEQIMEIQTPREEEQKEGQHESPAGDIQQQEKEEPNAIIEDNEAVVTEKVEEMELDNNELESEEEAKRAEEEMIKAYRKKKSDAEIKSILENFPQLARYYELIERAGSGTFSRVYKARDLLVNEYVPLTQRERLASTLGDDGDANYVAIKLIFDISKPERVANEIQCLASLRDSPGITPLITAFRHEALTFVVLPYIRYDHFDDFYRNMKADDVRSYISELLVGLKSAHEKGYMHRDVKPGNFLYNVKSKTGYLADFGLARMSSVKSINQNSVKSVKNSQYTQKEDKIGYYANDPRSPLQADRSGTKGFRAPEVMLRYRHQTSAIDIWAVGVIILIILTARYPIFEPEDDADGIMELAHVFGMKKLKEFTEYYGRTLHTNIPTIPDEPIDFVSFCRDINKEGIDKWDQEEYALAVDLMDQCLQLIHTNRITAEDALKHPFFTSKNGLA